MKKAAPCLFRDADGECGQAKNGPRHFGLDADHDYQPEAKPQWGSQRAPIPTRSDRPGRRQRAREGADEAAEHHRRVKHCEAPAHGITTPCRGRLQHSHRIGKGMGGGKDYAASDGECDILCEAHHIEIDTRRAEMRAAGLSKHAPRPAKVVPRPAESTPDRPRPVRRR